MPVHIHTPSPSLSLSPEFCSSFFGLVDVTGVQGACMIGSLAQGLVELELQDEAHKVSAKRAGVTAWKTKRWAPRVTTAVCLWEKVPAPDKVRLGVVMPFPTISIFSSFKSF